MKIELLALLDLVEALLKNNKVEKIENEPVQSFLQKHKDVKMVDEILNEVKKGCYMKAIHLIESCRVLCKELLTIYNAMQRDYSELKDDNFKSEISDILNEKYGVGNIKNVVYLLELKDNELKKQVAY